jgi:hypothetical protein
MKKCINKNGGVNSKKNMIWMKCLITSHDSFPFTFSAQTIFLPLSQILRLLEETWKKQ